MSFVILLSFCGQAAFAVSSGVKEDPVSSISKSTVKIRSGIGGDCTATIIAPRILLTAAHCIQGPASWMRVDFQYARDNWGRPISDDPINVLVHKQWAGTLKTCQKANPKERCTPGEMLDAQGKNNDLALILLPNDVPSPYKAIRLVDEAHDMGEIRVAGFADWSVLMSAPVSGTDVFEKIDVKEKLGQFVIENTDRGGSCKGDSGGPLYELDENGEALQLGVASAAFYADSSLFCGFRYTAYTSIGKYRSWIEDGIKSLTQPPEKARKIKKAELPESSEPMDFSSESAV